MLEKVQRKFTKRVPGLFNYTYAERRRELELDTLELRRLHIDLVLCYKMMNGKIDLDRDDFVTLSDNNLRGHSQKLVVPMAHKNCRKHSFPVRVVPLWNK